VESVLDCWRIEDEWWSQEPIDRVYFEVVLDTGRKAIFWADPEAVETQGESPVQLSK
jgi:hypothetical protein